MSHNNATLLNALTYDAMLEVLSHLSVQELGRLGSVSQSAKEFADDEILWRTRCRMLEGDWSKIMKDPAQPRMISANGMWKDAFKSERQRLSEFSKFIGLWSEKWCDVHVVHSTQIETDGTSLFVTYKKNKFSARFLKEETPGPSASPCDGESLSFHLEGGDSGWSFVYTLKPLSDSLLQLTVFRMHDKKTFTGFYTRT